MLHACISTQTALPVSNKLNYTNNTPTSIILVKEVSVVLEK